MDDDIFSQFDLGPAPAKAGGPKPPPVNPHDGEPRPNGRKKGKAAKGKRGRPKKVAAPIAEKTMPVSARTRAPRKPRETKISLTDAASAFGGLMDTDMPFVIATIRNMEGMSVKQKQRIVHTLTRLFA